jgi:hypothetical protein
MVNLKSDAVNEVIRAGSARPAHIAAPSVGGVIKKMLQINPELGADEMIGFIKQSLGSQGGARNDFASAEAIDEERALGLARDSLKSRR